MAKKRKMDRLTAAAAIRARVHAFFRAHPGACMGALAQAIPEREQSSLSYTVRKMIDVGHLRSEGRHAMMRYYAVGVEVESADVVRERVRAGARKAFARMKSGLDKAHRAPPSAPAPALNEPWITRNSSANKRAIPNQGGQGCVGVRPRMSASIGRLE